MAISTTFTLKFAGAAVERGLDRVQSAFKSLGGVAMKVGKSLLSPFAALTALLGTGALVGGLISFVKGSSEAASSVESLTTQFTTLLGSATAAKDRMKEITKFAASTPFEIAELAATSKLLEVMGGKLISTGDGLRLVGDAAAMAGQPIEEVGLHVGRLFSAITSGTSAGESVNRLQELGLITGATKIKFEELAEAQKKGTAATLTGEKALKLLQGVMSKAQGGMEALSATTEGKLSNMKDNITQLKVAFGTGFNIGLTDALDRINEILPKMLGKFKEFGLETGKVMIQLMDAFKQGRLKQVIESALMAGVTKAGEEMLAAMVFAGNALFDTIAKRMEGSSLGKLFNAPGVLGDTPMFNKLPTGAKFSGPAQLLRIGEMTAALKSHFETQQGSTATYQQTREGFRDALGSSEFIQVLRDTLKPPSKYLGEGISDYTSADRKFSNEKDLQRLSDILESIDKKLSPQP
jgi:hypothetical protein